MKFKIWTFFLAIVIMITAACTSSKKIKTTESRNWAREMLKWEKDFVDFGKVKKGDSRDFTYKFTNIAKENVEIMICTACTCTTLDWTTKVLKPGESGEVNAHFDSKEKDKGETINITVILKNNDPVMGYPIVDEVKFKFELE